MAWTRVEDENGTETFVYEETRAEREKRIAKRASEATFKLTRDQKKMIATARRQRTKS